MLSTVQDGNLLSPRRALTVEDAIVRGRGEHDTTLQMHGTEPEYA